MDEIRDSTEKAALIGKPEEIIRRIEELQRLGVEYIMLMDIALSHDALRTFAREVMPAFAKSKAVASAA
jgi:alkanesulfonate monooxygenase SsuD/methylene tetrahydromethanopterin reductase-like flavin-dependent oxidoreductase (luciferase family)